MITNFKIFENGDFEEKSWMFNIDDIVNENSVSFNDIDVISFEDVKDGDVVIAIFFQGNFDTYLMKVGKMDFDSELDGVDIVLGAYDDDGVHTLEHAWGVFDVEEYEKAAKINLFGELVNGTLTPNEWKKTTYKIWKETNKYNI